MVPVRVAGGLATLSSNGGMQGLRTNMRRFRFLFREMLSILLLVLSIPLDIQSSLRNKVID